MAWEETWAASLLGGSLVPAQMLSTATRIPSERGASLQTWVRAGSSCTQCAGKVQAGVWPETAEPGAPKEQ